MRRSLIAICAGLMFVVSAPQSFAGKQSKACFEKCDDAYTSCVQKNKKYKVGDKKFRYCITERNECREPCMSLWRADK